MKVWMTRSLSLGDVLGRWGKLRWEKEEINPVPGGMGIPPVPPRWLLRLLGLLGSSSVVVEDQGAHGHGQVGPAHTSLAAEEQRGRGSAGVPQQQAGALLGERDTGVNAWMDGDPSGFQESQVCPISGWDGGDGHAPAWRGGWHLPFAQGMGWMERDRTEWMAHPLHSPAQCPLHPPACPAHQRCSRHSFPTH